MPAHPMIVTAHAIQRYVERVRPVSPDEAITALSTAFIEAAASFGAPYVRLPTGQRVVIHKGRVVTVLPVDCWKNVMSPWRNNATGHTTGGLNG